MVSASELRQKDPPSELKRGFFARSTTRAYIEQLAGLSTVSLYTGAGISADIGTPLWPDMMSAVLLKWVRNEPELIGLEPTDADAVARRVTAALAKSYSPVHLASILRTMAVRRSGPADPAGDIELRQVMIELSRSGRTPGGFLARSVGLLGLSYRAAGRDVKILTSNYDLSIEGELRKIHDYSDYLVPYGLETITDEQPLNGNNIVAVLHVNGVLDPSLHTRGDAGLVVGETDFFARYDSDYKKLGDHEWRSRVLGEALSRSTTVFIGSSVTDPDVLAALANSKDQVFARYAILLRPELGPLSPHERRLAANLVGDRFEHLGVVPVIADFKSQVPQLLREVSLRLHLGPTYKPYTDRLDEWWDNWTNLTGGGSGRRSLEFQQVWHDVLCTVRDTAQRYLRQKTDFDEDELLMVEVWLRNPKERILFHWSSSEAIWLGERTAHVARIDFGDEYHVQKTFREGRTTYSELAPTRGLWKYYLGMPLILLKEPWLHLPIGVLSVLSTRPNGALKALTKHLNLLELFEDAMKVSVNELLDPPK